MQRLTSQPGDLFRVQNMKIISSPTGKFPMSPSTLDGSYNIGEDMDASNDGDSVDDGESQGDIDMEEGSGECWVVVGCLRSGDWNTGL